MSTLISEVFELGKLIGLVAFLLVFFAFSLFEIATFIRILCRMWKEHGNVVKK